MKLSNILLPYLIKKTARAHGFLDPVNVLSQISRFGQPSEVMVPTELLRSGALLHARGLINSQAIQHNLDWVWPYWVNCQFDPHDKAFVPRAFSATHINLTHRNWTAVGLPDRKDTPIVDPRGLVTPFWDGWSVDSWIIDRDKDALYPSKLKTAQQSLEYDDNLCVITQSQKNEKELISKVDVFSIADGAVCRISLTGMSKKKGWLVVSLRPHNPEGISFIRQVERLKDQEGWEVNGKEKVILSAKPEEYQLSEYGRGDVANRLFEENNKHKISCPVGMVTAAALYELKANNPKEISIEIPLGEKAQAKQSKKDSKVKGSRWNGFFSNSCALNIPDADYKKLYDTALRTLILHTAEDVYAGPYTYKRFWFRDAVFITYALLCAGFEQRAREIIQKFLQNQKANGYFASQEGEWDSNGQVLWLLEHYVQMTGQDLGSEWKSVVQKAARWIIRKRLPEKGDNTHAGLLPPGFSAEHLGPNDYYYWDNFWSVSGLQGAAHLMGRFHEPELAQRFREESGSMLKSIEASLKKTGHQLQLTSMPASPSRRMDSGAIGSLAAGYPLQLWEGKDQRLLQTASYLLENCFVNGGFFHDMSHSGINPYLTLHIAQVLLRAGDMKFYDLMNTIAGLASPTGQWPEAIHPGTGGGCMGDGQHVWAAAEWILMLRNCFVREDKANMALILCSGILPYWYANQRKISFGPAPTTFGKVTVSITTNGGELIVDWEGQWHDKEPFIEVRFPGFDKVMVPPGSKNQVILKPHGLRKAS